MIPSSVFQWSIAAAVLAIIGLTLVIRGIRGKRIGTHPFCTRCGFDLSGTIGATAAAGTAMPCPECGGDTTKRGAVRLGVRRPSVLVTIAGLFILFGGSGAAFWKAYPTAKSVTFISAEPIWLLLAQSDGFLGKANPALLVELVAREKAGTLADADLRTLVVRALSAQADMGRAWDTQWGDFVAAAHMRGLATEAQCQQFMQGAVRLTVLTREKVRARANTFLSWKTEAARGPSPTWSNRDGVLVRQVGGWCTVSRSGEVLDRFDPRGSMPDSQDGRFGYECGGGSSITHAWELSPGLYDLTIEGMALAGFRHMKSTDAGWRLAHSKTTILVLVPTDQPTVRAVPDAAMAESIKRDLSLQLTFHTRDEWDPACREFMPMPHVGVTIERKRSSSTLALTGYIRDRDHPLNPRTWPIERVIIEPPSSGYGFELIHASGFDCQRVDLVLRTSLDVAELSPIAATVWDGEIVFENVAVIASPYTMSSSIPKSFPSRVQSPAPSAAGSSKE